MITRRPLVSIRRPTRLRGASRLVAAVLLIGVGFGAVPARAADPLYRNQLQTARRTLSRGQFQPAAELFEKLLKSHPLDEAAASGLAEAWIGLERYADADTLIAGALTRVPGKADLYKLRVRLRRAQGRPAEAFQDLVSVLDADADRAPWAFRETRDLLTAGLDPKRALKIAEEARGAHPGGVPFAVLVAFVHSLDGREEEGLRALLADEEGQTLRGKALLLYAEQMLALQREDVAVAALQNAADRIDEAGPRSAVLFKVAEIQEARGLYSEALAVLKRIVDERPGTSSAGKALLASADIYQKFLNDPKGALAVYRQIQDDPIVGHRRPEMLLQMADCYVRLDDLDDAAATYASVIPEAVDPEHAETAAYKLAEVEFFRGNIDSALVLYQDMAERYPRSLLADDAAGHYILLNKHLLVGGGTAVQLLGRMEWGLLAGDSAAVDSCAGLLIENWSGGELAAEAHLGLADLAERSGRYPEAIEHLQKVVIENRGDPRAPVALKRQGDIYVQHLSRPKDAIERYETILTDYPNSVEAGEARRLAENLRRDLKS
jgi:tetratricopeptide (TPR) repeat protein